MVGVLTMAAAAAPALVKDYEIEVSVKFLSGRVWELWCGAGWSPCFWDEKGGTR